MAQHRWPSQHTHAQTREVNYPCRLLQHFHWIQSRRQQALRTRRSVLCTECRNPVTTPRHATPRHATPYHTMPRHHIISRHHHVTTRTYLERIMAKRRARSPSWRALLSRLVLLPNSCRRISLHPSHPPHAAHAARGPKLVCEEDSQGCKDARLRKSKIAEVGSERYGMGRDGKGREGPPFVTFT